MAAVDKEWNHLVGILLDHVRQMSGDEAPGHFVGCTCGLGILSLSHALLSEHPAALRRSHKLVMSGRCMSTPCCSADSPHRHIRESKWCNLTGHSRSMRSCRPFTGPYSHPQSLDAENGWG